MAITENDIRKDFLNWNEAKSKLCEMTIPNFGDAYNSIQEVMNDLTNESLNDVEISEEAVALIILRALVEVIMDECTQKDVLYYAAIAVLYDRIGDLAKNRLLDAQWEDEGWTIEWDDGSSSGVDF